MKSVMVDLETLDVGPHAVIVSIGAVAFDNAEIGEKLYLQMADDIDFQIKHKRTVRGDTVKWWMGQTEEARAAFTGGEQVTTLEALNKFSQFCARNGDMKVEIWGNGAPFDNVILRTLYEDLGFTPPWIFSHDRCYRTMKSIGAPVQPAARQGTHHNALDDAVTQAIHLQEIMKCLKLPL